jgi:hypothetical protein
MFSGVQRLYQRLPEQLAGEMPLVLLFRRSADHRRDFVDAFTGLAEV